VPGAQTPPSPGSSDTFEGFLTEVENGVHDAGQALLFAGDQLRLKVTLHRYRKNPRVVWGLKSHEAWAFKATLLRFARGSDPVHLLLSTEEDGGHQIQGWVVKRTLDAFWASPIGSKQAQEFLERRVVSRASANPQTA
jgi:hypothetical protein